MDRPMRHGRPARGPAVVYTALAFSLVVLVASLAFSARQPSPPQIAELTPQARHQIQHAPQQQMASVGAATGAPGGGATTTTTTVRPASSRGPLPSGSAPVVEAVARHCFGDPPRQISFDTQSPPCVAYWAGNNGGATWRGVTATTINIPIFLPDAWFENDTRAQEYGPRVAQDLQDFFNRTFELYGRQAVLKVITASLSDCPSSRSAADGISSDYAPFAVGDPASGPADCFFQELAHDHVVSVSYDPYFASSDLESMAPYIYQYPMPYDEQYAVVGQFICSELAGHAASYSPDPTVSSKTRRFGLIAHYANAVFPYRTGALVRALSACGASLAVVDTTGSPTAAWNANAVLQMKNAGVTTVICNSCTASVDSSSSIAQDASRDQYHPEWMLLSGELGIGQDEEMITSWSQPDEQSSVFSMTFKPAQVPYAATTLNQALASVDPGFQVDESVENLYLQELYWELLVVFSGIQMAGPDLTPDTFQRGLLAAHFPNPYSPEMEGAAGFAGNSDAMTADGALMWWSRGTQGPYPDIGPGAWCYVDGGRRWGPGQWAGTGPVPLFQGSCDVAPPGS